MPASETVPCARCGRPVRATAPLPLPTCSRCAGDSSFEVVVGGARVRLGASSIRARVEAGTLTGTDLIVEDGVPAALAAHPAFRTWFLPGHTDALPLPDTPARDTPSAARGSGPAGTGWRRTVVLAVGLVGLLATVAALAWRVGPELVVGGGDEPAGGGGSSAEGGASSRAIEVAGGGGSTTSGAAAAAAPIGPASTHPFDVFVARVGRVEEPRTYWLTEAWALRNRDEAAARKEAVAAAEKAVARAPTDPEALALLAAVYAEAGVEPELRRILRERARARGGPAPAVTRASTLVAIADGEAAEAARLASECAVPADLLCREATLLAGIATAPTPTAAQADNLVYALDELAAAWPENVALSRHAALVAARGDVVGAEARLQSTLKVYAGHAALLDAQALLALRNGASKTGRALLAKLEAPSDALLLEAAGDAVGRGDFAEALKLLGRRTGPPDRLTRVYDAQAKLLATRAGKGSASDALLAAERAARADGNGPVGVQVWVAAAMLAGDRAAAVRAWDALQARGGDPVDLGRARLALAASDYDQGLFREALVAVDAAIEADRAAPEGHLWKAAILASVQNAPGAVDALRSAVSAVDDTHLRRRAYGGALRTLPDAAAVRGQLSKLLNDDPTRTDDAALATAVALWLGGDDAGALAAVEPVAARGSDGEALALKARLLFARGQSAAALAAVDQALARRPKEATWILLRARALLAAGRAEEAEAALAVARSGTLPAGSMHHFAADLARRRGDDARAQVALRSASADAYDLVARRALRGVTED